MAQRLAGGGEQGSTPLQPNFATFTYIDGCEFLWDMMKGGVKESLERALIGCDAMWEGGVGGGSRNVFLTPHNPLSKGVLTVVI